MKRIIIPIVFCMFLSCSQQSVVEQEEVPDNTANAEVDPHKMIIKNMWEKIGSRSGYDEAEQCLLSWKEVIKLPEYRVLSEEEKKEMREDYFFRCLNDRSAYYNISCGCGEEPSVLTPPVNSWHDKDNVIGYEEYGGTKFLISALEMEEKAGLGSYSKCVSGDCKSGKGVFEYYKDFKYTGQFKNGKRHGDGTCVYPGGDKYTGQWKDGKYHGEGTYTADNWSNEENKNIFTTYTGQFKNGKKDGKGTFTTAAGNKYDGEWKNDKQNGYGIFTWFNGVKYEGQWKDGEYHGKGTYTDKSVGGKYTGQFKNGHFHGEGTYINKSGVKFTGKWSSGEFQTGECNYTERDYEGREIGKYTGSLKNGKRDGKGTYIGSDGTKYTGQYKDGLLNGIGTSYYDGEMIYTGQWKDDKYHGKGTYIDSDGSKYTGQFKDDVKHGYGTMIWPDGSKYTGQWKEDKMHGKGISYGSDGKRKQDGNFDD